MKQGPAPASQPGSQPAAAAAQAARAAAGAAVRAAASSSLHQQQHWNLRPIAQGGGTQKPATAYIYAKPGASVSQNEASRLKKLCIEGLTKAGL